MNTIVYSNGEVIKWCIRNGKFSVSLTGLQMDCIRDSVDNPFENIDPGECSGEEFALICEWVDEYC